MERNGDPVWGTARDGNGDDLLGVMLSDCRAVLRAGRESTIRELMGNLPDGYIGADPVAQRAAEFSGAL